MKWARLGPDLRRLLRACLRVVEDVTDAPYKVDTPDDETTRSHHGGNVDHPPGGSPASGEPLRSKVDGK